MPGFANPIQALNVALMPLAVLQHDPTHDIVHFDHRDAASRTHQAAHTFTPHLVRGFRAHLSAGGQRTASFVTVKMFQDLGAVLSHKVRELSQFRRDATGNLCIP